jgi:hypothetical protein
MYVQTCPSNVSCRYVCQAGQVSGRQTGVGVGIQFRGQAGRHRFLHGRQAKYSSTVKLFAELPLETENTSSNGEAQPSSGMAIRNIGGLPS